MRKSYEVELTKDELEFILDGGELGFKFPSAKEMSFWVRWNGK